MVETHCLFCCLILQRGERMHIFIKQICFSNLIPTWIDMLISTIPKDIYAQKFVAFTSSVLPLFSAACKPPKTPPPPLLQLHFFLLCWPTNLHPHIPPPSITPAVSSCCCLLPFIPLIFFSTPQCIHRTGTVSHMARHSLFLTAGAEQLESKRWNVAS